MDTQLSFPESALRMTLEAVAAEWGAEIAQRVTLATAACQAHAMRGGRVECDELCELIANLDDLVPGYDDARLQLRLLRSPRHPLAVFLHMTMPPAWIFRLAPRILCVGVGADVASVRVATRGIRTEVDYRVRLPPGTSLRLARFVEVAIAVGSRWYLVDVARVRQVRVQEFPTVQGDDGSIDLRWELGWVAWNQVLVLMAIVLMLGVLGMFNIPWCQLSLLLGVSMGGFGLWWVRRSDHQLLDSLIVQYESLLVEQASVARRGQAVTNLIGEHSAMLASARVVHEVSGPVGRLQVALEQLQAKGDHPDFAAIRTEIDRLAKVSHLVRAPRRQALPEPVRMSAEGLVALAVGVAGPQVQAAGGRVERSPIESSIRVLVIPDLLHPVVDNLVRNALQSGRPGVVPILSIACRQTGDRLVLTLRDNGSGMTPSVAERAFTTLFTTKAEGLGLGLAMCVELCALQDAQIGIESTAEGEGTEIGISYPLASPSGPQPAIRLAAGG